MIELGNEPFFSKRDVRAMFLYLRWALLRRQLWEKYGGAIYHIKRYPITLAKPDLIAEAEDEYELREAFVNKLKQELDAFCEENQMTVNEIMNRFLYKSPDNSVGDWTNGIWYKHERFW